ncbi:hypothetical protein ACEWY4_019318 [Coilia grayii]|uniref:Uncharacterized protein n=1 Tax=Coilia grayii TaxID=363190 RepID=A0ABD1JJ24_9TELE
MHAYRSMIDCLLNYSAPTLESQFTSGMFHLDTAGQMDAVTADANVGLKTRRKYSETSKEFELLGPLHSDIFFCDRLLLNGVDLKVKLVRARDEFCLMAAQDSTFKLHVLGASLFVKKVQVSAAVRLGHEAALASSNALYPIQRVVMKSYAIPQGSRVYTQENLFQGNLPSTIVLSLVDSRAYSGTPELNPLNFLHANCNFLSLYVDGKALPTAPFKPRYPDGFYTRKYYNLFVAGGRHLKDSSLAITKDMFRKGYTLYHFNLNRDDENDGAFSPSRQGCLRLEIQSASVRNPVLEINARRQILLDLKK